MAHEPRATKLDVLRFIRAREIVETLDLMNEFGYTYWAARRRVYRLEVANLLEKLGVSVLRRTA